MELAPIIGTLAAGLLAIGLAIYFFYGRRHSHLGKELRGEIAAHGISPAGTALPGPQVAD